MIHALLGIQLPWQSKKGMEYTMNVNHLSFGLELGEGLRTPGQGLYPKMKWIGWVEVGNFNFQVSLKYTLQLGHFHHSNSSHFL